MSSSITAPEGIINPPIDELLEATDSKYSLVIYAAKRARQINAYYSQLGEGLLEYVGPLVDTHVHEKPLSIALREINAGLLTSEAIEARRSSIASLQFSPQARQRDCRACGQWRWARPLQVDVSRCEGSRWTSRRSFWGSAAASPRTRP